MKNVIIAVDSFKGTFTSAQAGEIIEKAFLKRKNDISVRHIPMADGGEGSCRAVFSAMGGKWQSLYISDPIGRKVSAEYLILPDGTAMIESASACGLTLLGGKLSPLGASTYGVGEMLAHAARIGCKDIILAIGGTSTTDCGAGCLAALGAEFFDKNGFTVLPCGGNLSEIVRADFSGLEKRLAGVNITVLCDVSNPLYGKEGAAYVFAPQKGASPEEVRLLDNGLRSFADILLKIKGADVAEIRGGGAAGGMGAGLCAVGAQLAGGIETMLKISDFSSYAAKADLVITGEGRLDSQTKGGKVPMGVAAACGKTPVIAVCGEVTAGEGLLNEMGILKAFGANEAHLPFECVRDKSEEMLTAAAEKAAQWCIENKIL